MTGFTQTGPHMYTLMGGKRNELSLRFTLVYSLHAVFLGRCHMRTWGLCQPSWCTGTQCGYQASGTCRKKKVSVREDG